MILAGAGVGGLSAALALAGRGIEVTVAEQAQTFGEAGAGLQLSPNATRILSRWGLGAELARIGFAPRAAEVRDHASGRLLFSTELGQAAERRWGAPYLQVHRADVHALLAARVQGERRAELRLGARLIGFEQDATGVSAQLSSGETLRADALIGCDGVRSTVREGLHGPTPARFIGQVAWRGVVPAARLPAGLIPPVAAVWTGPRRHFVHYFVRNGELVNFLGVVEKSGWTAESWTEPGDPAELAATFVRWPESVRTLIQSVRETWRWALLDRPPMRRWSRARVSLLGDSAHPMPPFLAQGAAMAIEDADALAEALASTDDVSAALLVYEAGRIGRTARVQAWSRRNARLFHLPGLLSAPVFAAGRFAAPGQLDWLYGYGAST